MEEQVSKPTNLKELDQWIEQLNDCKQLTESQVKILCDKVKTYHILVLQLITWSLSNELHSYRAFIYSEDFLNMLSLT